MKIFNGIIQRFVFYVSMAFLVWELIVVFLNWANGAAGTYGHLLHTLLLGFGMLAACIRMKDYDKRQPVNFKVLFVNCFLLAFFVSLSYIVVSLGLYKLAIPEYVNKLVSDRMAEMLNDTSITQAQIDASLQEIHNRYSISGLLIQNLGIKLFSGTVLSLMISGVFSLKSED
jgi:ABC-type transport system involved in cytochrome bd biosynthesis fused ATPase/permease subunit